MEYQAIEFNELSKDMLDQLQRGAFLTTRVGEKVNTMTIAWGGLSVVWYKKVFVVYVRYSRHTYNMLEQSGEFTVSVPLSGQLKKELSFCGTKSGRDYDKIEECNLEIADGRQLKTPVLSDCELHFECKVVYKQAMEPGTIPENVKNKYYSNNNYHVVYFGEIVDSYLIKGDK